MADRKFSKIVDGLSPRQAEFTLKMRDAINAVALQYPDVFNPGWLLGTAIEMFIMGGARKEQVLELVESVWSRIEEGLSSVDEHVASIEARAGRSKN